MPKLSRQVLKDAFHASGEKNFQLSRLFYSALFGAGWDYALLGFSYMKLLDNLIDEDPDAERAAARLAIQRKLITECYSDNPPDGSALPDPERYGWHVFRYDHAGDSSLRSHFEGMIDTMCFDLERRGRRSTGEQLENWAKQVGGITIRYLSHFVSPRHPLPDSFVDHASIAYLRADSLIDLEEDLAQGLINIPSETIESRDIKLELADPGLRKWVADEAPEALRLLDDAILESKQLGSRTMRLLSWLYLSRKKRSLKRFLESEGF